MLNLATLFFMESVGYSKTPLVKKLGLKDGQSVLFVNQPSNYFDLLQILPEVKEAQYELDFIHLFVHSSAELINHLASLKPELKKTGMLWVSWPKKSSGVPSDLSDGVVREAGLKAGLVDTKVCAVDEIWSGLKFMYRISDR